MQVSSGAWAASVGARGHGQTRAGMCARGPVGPALPPLRVSPAGNGAAARIRGRPLQPTAALATVAAAPHTAVRPRGARQPRPGHQSTCRAAPFRPGGDGSGGGAAADDRRAAGDAASQKNAAAADQEREAATSAAAAPPAQAAIAAAAAPAAQAAQAAIAPAAAPGAQAAQAAPAPAAAPAAQAAQAATAPEAAPGVHAAQSATAPEATPTAQAAQAALAPAAAPGAQAAQAATAPEAAPAAQAAQAAIAPAAAPAAQAAQAIRGQQDTRTEGGVQPASAQADTAGLAQAMAQAMAPLINKIDERDRQAQEREQERDRQAQEREQERDRQAQEREQEREKQAHERHQWVLRSIGGLSRSIGGLSRTTSATLEHTAADSLERRLGVPVRQNVLLTGTNDPVDYLLGNVALVAPATQAKVHGELVRRLQPKATRVAVQYCLSRALPDLESLLQQQQQQQQESSDDPAAASTAANLKEHLTALQALQQEMVAGCVKNAGQAAKVLGNAQKAITGMRTVVSTANSKRTPNMPISDDIELGGGSDGGTGTKEKEKDPFAAAMQLLNAAAREQQPGKQRAPGLLQLLEDGAASMFVLSALQPAGPPPTGETSSGGGSSSNSGGGGGGGSGGGTGGGGGGGGGSIEAISAPVTELELDGLAVQLKDGTLQVVMLEAKSSSGNLPMARKQLQRAGTILAHVFNVAVAAGAFGGQPPKLLLEGRVALGRREGLPPPNEQMVQLVPAEGQQHTMVMKVTGLNGRPF